MRLSRFVPAVTISLSVVTCLLASTTSQALRAGPGTQYCHVSTLEPINGYCPPEFQNCSGAGYGSCFRLDDILIFPTGSGRYLAALKISAKVVLGQSEVAAKYVRIQANDLLSSFTRTVTTNSSGTADFGSMPEGEYQLTLVEETYGLELETDEVQTGPTPQPVRLRGTVQQTGFAFMDINENGTYESPTQNQIADEDLQVSGTFAWAGLDQNFGTSDDVSEEISGVGALRFPARLPHGNYRIRELKSAIWPDLPNTQPPTGTANGADWTITGTSSQSELNFGFYAAADLTANFNYYYAGRETIAVPIANYDFRFIRTDTPAFVVPVTWTSSGSAKARLALGSWTFDYVEASLPGLSPQVGIGSGPALRLTLSESGDQQRSITFEGAATLRARAFHDRDGNGQRGPTEPLLPTTKMKIEWFGLDGLEQTRRDNVTVLATVGAAGALLDQLPNSAHRVSIVPGTSGLPGERVTVDPDNVADGTTVTYPSANGVELLFGLQGQTR